MKDDNLDDTQRLVQSKGYNDALKEGLEAVEKAVSVGISKGPDDCAEYMLLQARQKGQEQWTNIYAAQLGQFISYGCEVRAITNDNAWNAAIEAAAKICDERNYTYVVAERIRKLKK